MSQQRDGKKFEPPPWEREQFEELAKRRSEGRDNKEITEAIRALEQNEQPVAAPQQVAPRGEIEEGRLIEMLSRLSVEEPSASEEYWRVGLLGSVITAAIGLMLVVLGVVGLARTAKAGPTGILGGVVLLGFGAGFLGVAAWMAVRTLKQRGVL